MKVKCISIYNDHTKKYETESYWITIGKEYTVLEILICPNGALEYRMAGDHPLGAPAIYKAFQFEIISKLIPSNWQLGFYGDDLIVVGPKAWNTPGFWDACYDGAHEEREIYRREAQIIMDEENSACT